MSEPWKQYRPKLAFYEILDKPGGLTVEQALARAQIEMEKHRGTATEALRDTIGQLEALSRARGEPNTERLYELSSFILDIAGIFSPPLCRAAHSLCELAQRMSAAGRWDWPSVDVHVGSMRLLMDVKSETDSSVQPILSGLAAVVAKHPDATPPDPPRPPQP